MGGIARTAELGLGILEGFRGFRGRIKSSGRAVESNHLPGTARRTEGIGEAIIGGGRVSRAAAGQGMSHRRLLSSILFVATKRLTRGSATSTPRRRPALTRAKLAGRWVATMAQPGHPPKPRWGSRRMGTKTAWYRVLRSAVQRTKDCSARLQRSHLRPHWSVKTTRGVVSHFGPLAIHTRPSRLSAGTATSCGPAARVARGTRAARAVAGATLYPPDRLFFRSKDPNISDGRPGRE